MDAVTRITSRDRTLRLWCRQNQGERGAFVENSEANGKKKNTRPDPDAAGL